MGEGKGIEKMENLKKLILLVKITIDGWQVGKKCWEGKFRRKKFKIKMLMKF